MVRISEEDDICDEILEELHDISEKKGITFNQLFKKVKEKRGKFSYDTLSKYLKKMQQDGRIIRVIDVESSRKIKPTFIYKNLEMINLRDEKNHFSNVLMDKTTRFYQYKKQNLKVSDLFPQFNEIFLTFLEKTMKINLDHFENENLIDWDTILNNFNLFLVEKPEIKRQFENFDDIILLIYRNLLEILLNSEKIKTSEIQYNLFFQINLNELLATIILKLTKVIQKNRANISNLFHKEINLGQLREISEEEVLKLLLNQLDTEVRENIKNRIQKQKLEEFSEKYKKSLEIY